MLRKEMLGERRKKMRREGQMQHEWRYLSKVLRRPEKLTLLP
jgi:hypothetical protein